LLQQAGAIISRGETRGKGKEKWRLEEKGCKRFLSEKKREREETGKKKRAYVIFEDEPKEGGEPGRVSKKGGGVLQVCRGKKGKGGKTRRVSQNKPFDQPEGKKKRKTAFSHGKGKGRKRTTVEPE